MTNVTNVLYWIGGKCFKHQQLEDFKLMFGKTVWFTYRNGIPEIETGITSDFGWGCLLRCLQMILIASLNELFPEKDHLSMFLDKPDALFSIHQLCYFKKGLYDTNIIDWIGPYAASYIAHHINKTCPTQDYNIIVVEESVINRNLILDKPTIMFLPVRLGIDKIDMKYYIHLYTLFTNQSFKGFISGQKGSGYYFNAIDSDFMLYYLDPHYLQDCKGKIKYYTNDIKKIHIYELDPNVSFCFSIKSETEYKTIVGLFDELDGLPIKVVDSIQYQNKYKNTVTTTKEDEWLMID